MERPSSAGPPVDLTTFVGRTHEIGELRRLIADSRLLTLTGSGGSGKSRLAREAVEPATGDLGVPYAWVELAALEDSSLLARRVAESCGVREEVRGDAATLAGLLRGRPLLLVLDNCEHLVEACASLVDVLLRSCPDLRVVATSREPLGVPGERAWLVPGLDLPPEDVGDAATVGASEAVRLFGERARDAVASWELTDGNAPAVAEICRRLDGIPLAIELAAARVRVLDPRQIQDRLDQAFHLLTSGGRTSLPRHRTLRATMDWSHGLLSDRERVLLRRLSVFRGGFPLEATEVVGAGDAIDRLDVLDLLARLADRSLVSLRDREGRSRYRLLETVRQYAAEKLAESGEEDEVRARHARWVAELAARAEPHLTRRERPDWVARLHLELDNLREGLAWSRAGAPALHVELVGRLWWFWFSTQHWTEAGRWIHEALALPEAATGPARARLLFAAGALAGLRARGEEARPLLEEAVGLARAAGDEQLEAYALNYIGLTWAGQGDPRGQEPLERAAAWFEAHDDLYGLRLALLLLGSSALGEGDLERAEAMNLRGVEVARRFGLDREISVSLGNLAVVYLMKGDVERADHAVRAGLDAARRDPSWYFIANALQYMAEVLGHRGDPLEAARMLGASEAMREAIGTRAFPLDAHRLEGVLPDLRAAAGEEAFEKARDEGRRLAPLEAVDRVLGDAVPGTGEPADRADGGRPGAEAEPEAEAEGDAEVGPGTMRPDAAGSAGSMEAAAARPAPGTSPDADLIVRALGTFEVRVRGATVGSGVWPYVKPRELLVMLLLHPRGRTREQIGQTLWPDSTPAQAANSFHVTVHHLRKALGRPEWVEREGDRYRLAQGVSRWFDGDAFEEWVREALREQVSKVGPSESGLRAALDLYGGDLMEGEAVGGWLEDDRDRLRAVYVDAALALGTVLEREDRWDEAAALYAAVVPREDLNEELHRRLMTCWARAGERTRALKHYERVEQLLRDALDAEPEVATRQLVETLREG